MKKIKKNIVSIFIFTILGPALLVFAQQRSDLQEDYATKRKGTSSILISQKIYMYRLLEFIFV